MVRGSTVDMTKMLKNNCDVDLLIHNKFEIEVTNAETGEVKQKAEGYNVIKDTFWNYLFAENSHRAWFQAIVLGSGSGTPSADTPGLFSFIGGKTATGNTFKTVPEEGYAYHRRSIQLGVSEFVGQTITEVGIAYTSSSNSAVLTHAMLQDMNGNQISITKTDTDIITIYATVYVHWNPAGYEDGRIKISYNGEKRPRDGGLISELLGYLHQSSDVNRSAYFYSGPGCATSIGSADGSLVKDINTRTYKLTYGRLAVGSANVASGILSAYSMNVYMEAPCGGLPGTNIVAEAIGTGDGTTTKFNTKFPFPRDAEIFVDGVLYTDVIVDADNPGTVLPYTTAFKFLPEHSDIPVTHIGIPMGTYPGDCGRPNSMGGNAVFENPWAKYGFSSIYRGYDTNLEVSDDLINWHPIPKTGTHHTSFEATVPAEYAYCKYWKFINPSTALPSGYQTINSTKISTSMIDTTPKANIRFTTPPAEGAVITANYYTPVVAKDSDHVFDMSITIHLGEYTE